MKGLGVTAEQQALLGSQNYSLKPLSTAGHLSFPVAFRLAWLPFCISTFTLLCLTCSLRLTHEAVLNFVYWSVLLLLLAPPIVSLAVIVFGIVMTKLYSTVKWPAAVYWAWWPFWKVAICLLSAVVTCSLANGIWYNYFLPYHAMLRLQAYNNINPAVATGERLQDVGVAVFNKSANVDRARTGCLKNDITYCVAPIILGSEFDRANGGQHDLFMAGTDCCTCPGEFRCGAWNVPMSALGGMRIIDNYDVPFYRLASEDWAATYGVVAKRPIFFKWVADPVTTWRDLRTNGVRFLLLAIVGSPFAFVCIAFALNAILSCLHGSGYVDPVDGAALATPGMGKAMMHQYMDRERQQEP